MPLVKEQLRVLTKKQLVNWNEVEDRRFYFPKHPARPLSDAIETETKALKDMPSVDEVCVVF